MARIRSIKPSIWGDARFAGLSRDARLLTLGLISNADDAGRFIASPTAVAGAVYPHDEVTPTTIRKWRDEVARCGLIEIYRVEGREYGWFPKWKRHQKINRPTPSVLPAPPGFGGDPGPFEPPPDDEHSVSHSLNGSMSHSVTGSVSRSPHPQGATHGTLTTRKGVGEEKERNSPQPPAPQGASRCTRHQRPRRGCVECTLPPLAPVPEKCPDCSPSRRIEADDGSDLGPCPRCHPSTVRTAADRKAAQ